MSNPAYIFTATGSIQTYTVLTTGIYEIDSVGASGGSANGSHPGGNGASVAGDVYLSAGTILQLVVGQQGSSASVAAGGGGGTFVYYTSGGMSTLLEAAGGGGGAGLVLSGQAGSSQTSGVSGIGNAAGAGGSSGSGGSGATYYGGGGGGGWLTAGGNNGYHGAGTYYGGYGGGSLSQNFLGGSGGGGVAGSGGYGGGSAGWSTSDGSESGGGAGGGYSGGGGGGYAGGSGGGGGSYLVSSATNQLITSGANIGNGMVNIALVTAITPPSVTSINLVEAPVNHASTLHYTVTFNEAVTGVDMSDFTVVGTGTAVAYPGTPVSTDGGITWTVPITQVSGDGALQLNLNSIGTGITDVATSTAITGGYSNGQTYTVQHTPPVVTSVTVPNDAHYATGQNLNFTVYFSEVVTVDTTGGAPRIAITLNTGGTVYAQYLSGSGTNALVFRDTVQTGQQDLDGITVGMLDLNGGSIVDAAGNVAMTTLNSVGPTAGILVNTPVITTTNLVASTTIPTTGNTITLTATETDGNSTLTGAGGTVTFSDGSTVIGTANVVNGIATFTTSALSAGAHNYSVLYSGDTFDQSSNFGINNPLVVTASTPTPPVQPAPVIPIAGVTNSAGLVQALQNQTSPDIFTSSTIDQILALTKKTIGDSIHFDTTTNSNASAPSSTDVLFVASAITTPVTITNSSPVIIFQGNGGVNATLNNGVVIPSSAIGSIDRIVVGNSGNDHIQISDATNTQVILGSGNNTVVGNGDNSIVQLSGSANNYTVTSSNGHAIVTNNSTQSTTDISKIQYVQLDSGSALIFASNTEQAAVATLYHSAFGRTADDSGMQYWYSLANSGASLSQIANAFTQSAEFLAESSAMSNTQFVQALYQNTFGRTGEATGIAYWTDALAHGNTRADLIGSFASIAASNLATTHTEAQVVGNVTIVSNII